MLSGDCDDLVTLLGACFLTVGLPVMIVGHAYGASRNISHVLTAVRVDGRWLYADPTPDDFKLGECVEFSRERILSVPNIQMLCDDDVCLSDKSSYSPEKNNFVERGHFIGVDGVAPKFAWLRPPPPQMLGQGSNVEQVMDACLDASLRADVSTAAARERAFGSGARCAADAYCAIYRVPPGICSSIVGPVADAIADFWSSIFGGDQPVDCAKISTFDECHFCRIAPTCMPGQVDPVTGFVRTPESASLCLSQKTRACHERERKRIAAETVRVAERAAAEAQKRRVKQNVAMSVGAGAAAGAALWYFLPAVRSFFR